MLLKICQHFQVWSKCNAISKLYFTLTLYHLQLFVIHCEAQRCNYFWCVPAVFYLRKFISCKSARYKFNKEIFSIYINNHHKAALAYLQTLSTAVVVLKSMVYIWAETKLICRSSLQRQERRRAINIFNAQLWNIWISPYNRIFHKHFTPSPISNVAVKKSVSM